MAKPMRFGICGCGGIAGLHADCLKKLEQVGLAKLVAGAEPDAARREKFGTKWGAAMHDSLESLLKRDDIDAITICSPSGLHGRQVAQIAAAKRHILCEKPLDLKLDEADRAIAAAKKQGVVLGGIFQQRFAPGPQKVKRAVDAGAFGKIVYVHCETPWYRSQGYYDADAWRGTWDLDCGVLANQSPHMIDRLLWLGGEVEEVTSAVCKPGFERNIEAETLAVATVRLNNGALGTITGTTLAYSGLPQRVLICGTSGSAAFQGDELTYFKTEKTFEDEAGAADAPGASTTDGAASALAINPGGHLENIRDFVLAVSEGRTPAVTGEDQRKVTRVLTMIYEKAGVGPYRRE